MGQGHHVGAVRIRRAAALLSARGSRRRSGHHADHSSDCELHPPDLFCTKNFLRMMVAFETHNAGRSPCSGGRLSPSYGKIELPLTKQQSKARRTRCPVWLCSRVASLCDDNSRHILTSHMARTRSATGAPCMTLDEEGVCCL